MSFDLMTTEEQQKLNQWLSPARTATTLTKKEEATNAAILQQAIEDDKPYEPKHIIKYLPNGSEGYSGEVISLVYSLLRKCGVLYGYYASHAELLEMSVDRISRFAAIRDFTQTLQGSYTPAKIKTAACGLCTKCKRRRRRKVKLNKAACLDVQTRTTQEHKAKPAPTTFDQWRHALVVECSRRDYVKNRGYLKGDDRLTYLPHEEIFRFVGKPHSLRPLSEAAATYVRLDCLTKEEKNASTLCAAALDGLLDSLDETIILIRATGRNQGTDGNQAGRATPTHYNAQDIYKALINEDIKKGGVFGYWFVSLDEVKERIERIKKIATLRYGQKLPQGVKPHLATSSIPAYVKTPAVSSGVARASENGEAIPTSSDLATPVATLIGTAQDCTPQEDHRVKWATWAADNMVTDAKTAERLDAYKKANAERNSARPDEFGRTPTERLDAARTRSEKRQPRRTDEKTLRALKAAKEHNELVRFLRECNAKYAGETQN